MFDPTDTPRAFGLPPGVDFPVELVAGLRARLQGHPPEAMARVEIYVNTRRMARRLRDIFDAGPACLLPRIRLVTDLADPLTAAHLPQPVPPLRRRLELTALVAQLLDSQPDLAPRAALFDLSDSLATLMDEMMAEDVPPEVLEQLDVTDQSGHWQRALTFLQIVQRFFDGDEAPDAQGFQRLALAARLAAWEAAPPRHPILVAGSTGSRGTTAAFMRAVARLPQGAVVLPGFDTDLPHHVWRGLDDAMKHEDHPQFRFARMLQELDLAPQDVPQWTDTQPPAPGRNAVLSLALRPAPVTHQWRSEGPRLPDLPGAMQGVTLTEAPDMRTEALAIALRLRQTAEDGTRAALITPDRMLTRQVTSALDRWNILPDDSAGTPGQLTPPGRFLRHVAALFRQPLTAETLVTLLKHPLTHTGADRGPHLLNTRELELRIRRKGWPYPDPDKIREWGAERDVADWADWVAMTFSGRDTPGIRPLADWIEDHLTLSEAIAAGPGQPGSGELWQAGAGRKLYDAMQELRGEAAHGTDMSARDYGDLVTAILSRQEVRDRDAPHPDILIWGTLEARVMGADLVILGGLNEGAWPELPGADPWLNRQMRHQAGLLLPERTVGLSAHDFQQAVGAPEVWLTRALKSDEAETVPSRWVNRLTNLMTGLPTRDGPQALAEMRQRGNHWLALARAAETPIASTPAPRPAPAPPVTARPKKLSVTQIKTLVRDPYAIYAREVLRLRPLDPLQRAPDALLRGIQVHEMLEHFVRDTPDEHLTPQAFHAAVTKWLGDAEAIPFPTVRALWQARLNRVARWFTETEATRRTQARPTHFETEAQDGIPALDFALTAKADRLDLDTAGNVHLYDYKTGAAPSAKEQAHFDKQLLLEAAMAERGSFKGIGRLKVARATYISLTASKPQEVAAPLDDMPPAKVWEEFETLIAAYMDPAKGFAARRALRSETDVSDYGQLSRFGEWDVTDDPQTDPLT
ncbi:double-strand break repair protein AddB [Allosediminivita pacifica]|uniref:Double-strand break repair protein AddB n=1 Tax=Allosediminivita pacifica TaxID=1267769 RepID=A0A2T6AR58_9RHOB|nr:double-strand break repair protein AddB [Allosediminivita pacifica]PTX46309.1 double-strand break repair protein AddB [Allosediminivita pacifica]GGB18063.1 double-strand break repair protein AddB [Allosediminivita pacifica]